MIIADKSYEVADPTLDSQIVALKDSARYLHDLGGAQGRSAGNSQGRRARLEAGLFPRNVSTSAQRLLKPAGLENSRALSRRLYQGPDRSVVEGRSGIKAWAAFMDKYFPDGDKTNNNNVYGYATARPWCRC